MSSFLRRGHFVSEGSLGEGKKQAREGGWEEEREPLFPSHCPLCTNYSLIITDQYFTSIAVFCYSNTRLAPCLW